jgi:hypothetical protein
MHSRRRRSTSRSTGPMARRHILNRRPEAHRALIQSSETPFVAAEIWFMRLQSAKLANDFGDAFVAIKTLQEKWPHPILRLKDFDVSNIEQGMGTLPDAEEAQLAFECYIDAVDWQPINPFFSKSVIRFHQAEQLCDKGDHDGAYAIASQIEDAGVLEAILADKRFDVIVAGDPQKFNSGKSAENRVEKARSDARQNPHRSAGSPKWGPRRKL